MLNSHWATSWTNGYLLSIDLLSWEQYYIWEWDLQKYNLDPWLSVSYTQYALMLLINHVLNSILV